jgi:hypothetical protein
MLYAFWNVFAEDFTSLVFYIGLTMTIILAHKTTTSVASHFRSSEAMHWQYVCPIDNRPYHMPEHIAHSRPIIHWLIRITMRKDGPDDDSEAESLLYVKKNHSIQQGGNQFCNAHLYPLSLKSTVLS